LNWPNEGDSRTGEADISEEFIPRPLGGAKKTGTSDVPNTLWQLLDDQGQVNRQAGIRQRPRGPVEFSCQAVADLANIFNSTPRAIMNSIRGWNEFEDRKAIIEKRLRYPSRPEFFPGTMGAATRANETFHDTLRDLARKTARCAESIQHVSG
jgi:hypothetical protein